MPRGGSSVQNEGLKILLAKLTAGKSKHTASKEEKANCIFSYSTFRSYAKHAILFLKWAHRVYGCKTVAKARPYVDEWLVVENVNQSRWTVKLRASALAKLYDCSTKDFAPTGSRHRQDIMRSRGLAVRDKHFSAVRNADFINFCRATGLRRHEIHQITVSSLVHIDGVVCLHVKGKGGRWRDAPIIGPHADGVIAQVQAAGDDPVWPRIPVNAGIHGYRRDYTKAIYAMHARDNTTLSRSERYDCRGDLAGVCYDRVAMLIASRALGHNRISVIAGNYIV